jgi:hypothetical protein
MLRRCSFGEKWCKWIVHCISTVCFSVLINGTPTGFFNSSCGRRQRDPLFPLLFVVVMEVLSRMLSATLNRRFLSGFFMGSSKEELFLTHLLFADNTLIFCEANPNHLRHLHSFLLCFEVVLGFKINLAKSELVPVVAMEDVKGLAPILGCRVSFLPMKYPSLPLGASFKEKSVWDGIFLRRWNTIWLVGSGFICFKGARITLIWLNPSKRRVFEV